jgi:hypothetical protein
MKFVFIAKHRTIWPVAWLCEAMGVSRSGFHAWLNRSPSAMSTVCARTEGFGSNSGGLSAFEFWNDGKANYHWIGIMGSGVIIRSAVVVIQPGI